MGGAQVGGIVSHPSRVIRERRWKGEVCVGQVSHASYALCPPHKQKQLVWATRRQSSPGNILECGPPGNIPSSDRTTPHLDFPRRPGILSASVIRHHGIKSSHQIQVVSNEANTSEIVPCERRPIQLRVFGSGRYITKASWEFSGACSNHSYRQHQYAEKQCDV